LCIGVKIDVDADSAEIFDGLEYRVRIGLKFTLEAGTDIPVGFISGVYDILVNYGAVVTISKEVNEDGNVVISVVLFFTDDALEALGESDIEALKTFFTEIMNEQATENRLTLTGDAEVNGYVVEELIDETTGSGDGSSAVVITGALSALAVVML